MDKAILKLENGNLVILKKKMCICAQNMKNIAIKRTNIDEKVHDCPIFIDIFVKMTEKIKMYINENPTFFQMRGLSTLLLTISS